MTLGAGQAWSQETQPVEAAPEPPSTEQPPTESTELQALLNRARQALEDKQTALQAGDWVASGQAEGPPSSPDVVTGEVGRRVDDYLSRLVPYGLSGSVLIARDGAILLEKGYGLANRASSQPYRADTIASIGSITKQFTGAAIVKLEMDGKLKARDPISKYLPNVPADKSGITIHHGLRSLNAPAA